MATKKKNTNDSTGKKKTTSFELVTEQIIKTYGEGAVFKGGDKPLIKAKAISTQCPAIDFQILGIGGIPRGRITEIYGPESSGKTTLCLHIIAEAQRIGGKAAIIDSENALDRHYASRLGVDVDNLYICQPDYGEQGLDIACKWLESGELDVLVIDSVATLVPRAEIEGDFGDNHVGLQAKMMAQALRKLLKIVESSDTALIFTNQLRSLIGGYGGVETTPGGRALRFAASIRLDLRASKADQIKKGAEVIGQKVKVKAQKNKVAPPFREMLCELYFGKGFSKESSILDLGEILGLVQKSGAWWMPDMGNPEFKLQGKSSAVEWLEGEQEKYYQLYEEVRKVFTQQNEFPMFEISVGEEEEDDSDE